MGQFSGPQMDNDSVAQLRKLTKRLVGKDTSLTPTYTDGVKNRSNHFGNYKYIMVDNNRTSGFQRMEMTPKDKVKVNGYGMRKQRTVGGAVKYLFIQSANYSLYGTLSEL